LIDLIEFYSGDLSLDLPKSVPIVA